MSDQLIAQARDLLEAPIVCVPNPPRNKGHADHSKDFEGQKKAEYLSTIVLVLTGVRRSLLDDG